MYLVHTSTATSVSWRWQSRILEELAVNSRRGGGLPVPIYKQLVLPKKGYHWMTGWRMVWIYLNHFFCTKRNTIGFYRWNIKIDFDVCWVIENLEVVGAWFVWQLKTNSTSFRIHPVRLGPAPVRGNSSRWSKINSIVFPQRICWGSHIYLQIPEVVHLDISFMV